MSVAVDATVTRTAVTTAACASRATSARSSARYRARVFMRVLPLRPARGDQEPGDAVDERREHERVGNPELVQHQCTPGTTCEGATDPAAAAPGAAWDASELRTLSPVSGDALAAFAACATFNA